MLKLKSSLLEKDTLTHLADKQAVINALAVSLRVARAQTLWDSKSSAARGKIAFDRIKQTLIKLCVSIELCNYCEHNEATDIEHIYPKSFFPERTFLWSNYLLACKTCNTHYKLDQFAVFIPAQSATASMLQRKQIPASNDAAFIDPRIEDPMHYLFLDITGKSFYFTPHPSLTDPRDIAKADRTLAVLQIGQRAGLARARKDAFEFYQSKLERYRDVQSVTTWEELEHLVQDPHLVDRVNNFESEKQLMLAGLKRSILEHLHPTVWYEMQRQHQLLNKTKRLFEDVPDALTWK